MREIAKMTRLFEIREGRRPRIMIENIESDDDDFYVHKMASGFANLGFDVDLGAVFHSAEEMAKQAVENDAHVIVVISGNEIEESLLKDLSIQLKLMGRKDIKILCRRDSSGKQSKNIKYFQKSTPIAEVAYAVLKHLHT